MADRMILFKCRIEVCPNAKTKKLEQLKGQMLFSRCYRSIFPPWLRWNGGWF